jgi:hypothetical protein
MEERKFDNLGHDITDMQFVGGVKRGVEGCKKGAHTRLNECG